MIIKFNTRYDPNNLNNKKISEIINVAENFTSVLLYKEIKDLGDYQIYNFINYYKIKIKNEYLEESNIIRFLNLFEDMEETNNILYLIKDDKFDEENIKKVENLLKIYDFKNIFLEFDYNEEVTGDNLKNVNLRVLAEVFEESINGWLIHDFISKIILNQDSLEIYKMSKKVGEMDYKEVNIDEILLDIKNWELELDKLLMEDYLHYPFRFIVHEFLFNLEEKEIKNILNHKWNVFEFISKLDVDDILELPSGIVGILVENEFVPFPRIINTIEGVHPFLKYYKEMEGII